MFSNVESLEQYSLFKTYVVRITDGLALKLEVDLVEWPLKVLLSIPDAYTP